MTRLLGSVALCSFNRSSRLIGSFAGYFLKVLGSYCWCQCAPSLLVQMAPVSVVSWNAASPLAGAEVSFLAFGGASLLYAGVNSMRTALPVHCGLIFFHFLPPLRLSKRLPALSRERKRFPRDTDWPSPFTPKAGAYSF